jgi:hypothetical protein
VANRDVIETDSSRWPVVVHRTIGRPGDAEVDAFIARANELLARKAKHVIVFDNTDSGMPSGYMRKKNMEWLDARQHELILYCVATAFVFPSAAMRFVMSTALLVWSNPVEHEVFASVPEAEVWASNKLKIALSK